MLCCFDSSADSPVHYGPVRQPIDLEALTRYVETHLPSTIRPPLHISQFGYGQSNPTYLLTDAASYRFVLRKKPPGKLLSRTAHKVDREHRVITALRPTNVPVPRTYSLCEDDSGEGIGTPFYIMEFLSGRIFEDATMDVCKDTESVTAMWQDAVRTLGRLHSVDVAAIGLSSFGKPDGFYTRQLQTFSRIHDAQASTRDVDSGASVGPLPHYQDMVAFFSDKTTQPAERSTLVHGDYKIDNLVFHPEQSRVIGILDWEMSTIGHPLSDLANLLTPYSIAAYDLPHPSRGREPASSASGPMSRIPPRKQLLRWYAEAAGWDPSPTDLTWADAFALFRLSIIMQGIAARYAVRQASSAAAREYAGLRGEYAEAAWKLVEACRAERKKEKARL